MNIVVDVDDVLRDFIPQVIKRYNYKYNEKASIDDVVNWELDLSLPKMNDFHNFVRENSGELLIYSDKIPLAKEFMDRLKTKGHHLTIATHQFKDLEGFTYTWLQKNQMPYDVLFFGREKWMLEADVIIDDKYRNVQKFKMHNRGSLGLLMDKPWNRYVDPVCVDERGITEYVQLTRVKNLKEAYHKILKQDEYKRNSSNGQKSYFFI